MTDSSKKAPLEKEIQSLLMNETQVDVVADHLIRKYSVEKISLEDLQVLAQFFLNCGFYSSLCEFLVKCLERNLNIPWGHFCYSLFKASSHQVPLPIQTALTEGAEFQKLFAELARCHKLDSYEPELINERFQRKQKIQIQYQKQKEQWLSELETFRSQGLLTQEQQLLEKLQRFYPRDTVVAQKFMDWRERQALGLLHTDQEQRSRWIPIDVYQQKDPTEAALVDRLVQTMKSYLQKHPEFAKDFIIALIQMEYFEHALGLLQLHWQDDVSFLWLRLELLLITRNFLELLQTLDVAALQLAEDPESTFEILYLRAQALWGLHQKQSAIDILESIATSRPQYRATTSLLTEWKMELT